MYKKILPAILTAVLITPTNFVYAQSAGSTSSAAEQQITPVSPIPELQQLSSDMIAALKANKASMAKNPQVVYGIVNKILLPYADTEAMAKAALGRDAWLNATPDQQQRFIAAFTNLMIQTYAAGLSSYTDEKVQFSPIRGGMQPGVLRVAVDSRIIRNDGPPIPVSYRLVYKKDKTTGQYNWYVYDFSVEGISMIQSFRSQFADEISSGMSLDVLIQKLVTHNAKQQQQS